MKIAYIAHIRLTTERAHGYATMKLCEEFAREGHEVELIVPDKWAPALKEKDPFVLVVEPARTLESSLSLWVLGVARVISRSHLRASLLVRARRT